jgi:3-dehydroquinate synthase
MKNGKISSRASQDSTVSVIPVALAGKEYDILIGRGLLDAAGKLISPFRVSSGPIAIVTDENVWRLWGERLKSSLSDSGIGWAPVIFPAGEASKTLDGLSSLYDGFARMALGRDGLVIAFGGGVAGDMAGFAAATWMRGVRYVQIPTTLLSQIDSSVGGKTAINLPHGKNLAGAFHQPKLVLIDPATLETLPEREIKCGMAEAIKYGAIRSAALFEGLAEKTAGGLEEIGEIIGECCRIKSEITARDEFDSGERMLLNFGHTFGHAIEKVTGFGSYSHGEAVAFGMAIAADLGERAGFTRPGTGDEIRRALAAWGLAVDCPIDTAELLPLVSFDKKSVDGGTRMIFLRRIGEAFINEMSFTEIGALMKAPKDQAGSRFEGGL